MKQKIIRLFTKQLEYQRGKEYFNTLYNHYISSLEELPYSFIEEVIKGCIEVRGYIYSIDFMQLKDAISITFYIQTEYYTDKEYTFSVHNSRQQFHRNYPMYILLGNEDIVTFLDIKCKFHKNFLKSVFGENLIDVSNREFSLPISYFCK